MERGGEQFVVRGDGWVRSAEDLEETVVAYRDGVPVLLRQLAETAAGTVEDGYLDLARRAPGDLSAAERRLVSVLFADLVAFTSYSEGRDPETVRETLTRYFEATREVIERHGGVVEKFIGDAVMAEWGAPRTNEDDAERAVRAGRRWYCGRSRCAEAFG